MDVKQIAAECYLTYEAGDGLHAISVSLIEFAQKIIAERDKEWMAEPVAWINKQRPYIDSISYTKNQYATEHIPLFIQPKDVK